MRKALRAVAVLIAAVVCGGVFAACGGGEDRLIAATVNDSTQKEYYKGEDFDLYAVNISLEYVKNGKKILTPSYDLRFGEESDGLEYSVSGFDSSVVSDSVPVTINVDGGSKFSGELTLSFSVKILPAKVISSEVLINKSLCKTEYLVGDEFDSTGIMIKKVYSDGTEESVPATSENLSGFDTSKAIAIANMAVKEGTSANSFDYSVSPGAGYTKYAHTFLTSSAYAYVRFFYPDEYTKTTISGLPVFNSTDKGNFNISRDNAINYETFSQTIFKTGMSIGGINANVSNFEKSKLNGLNAAIIDYSFDYVLTFNQRAVWIFGSSYTLVFTFTYPQAENVEVEGIFNTIIGSISM